ncbi:MAG: class I SAM-dependent methyltransferase [Bacteroidota bacterium]
MSAFGYTLNYLKYYLTAQTKHDVHSPFVFDFITSVINKKTSLPEFEKIENLRKELLKDDKIIDVTDYGTAFKGPKTYQRKISAITYHSAKPAKYAQLLFRIVNYFKPETILELGTSFGITTMYMSSANIETKVITLEGCSETAKVANVNFQNSGIKNIEQVTGDFNITLDAAINKFEKLDFVFFDGNHQKEPTLNYFQKCLSKSHNKSIFIFDDINWSAEMKEAWKEIQNHPKATVTIDLFILGIVFFNADLTKQNFVIRF